MDYNNIYLGDAYKLIKEIPDNSIDLIVTDPPYDFDTKHGFPPYLTGIKFFDDIKDNKINQSIDMSILDDFMRICKIPNIYIWCNRPQILNYLKYFVENHDCKYEIIIWNKTNVPPMCNGHYLVDKEYCLYFYKGIKLNTSYDTAMTVYRSSMNVEDKKYYHHPTIKPESIIKNMILNSSNENDIVFDPFSGSGTTCKVAKDLNRRYIGFEINEKYYEISKRRLKEDTQMSLF